MHRVPLADELPYRFYPPRIDSLVMWAGRFYLDHLLRRVYRIHDIDVGGLEAIPALAASGDGVLLAPNHADYADCYALFELGRRIRLPFYYMTAYQLFVGNARWALPRIGAFPVDREGSDLRAFKTAVELLARKTNPLVIFPEGEIYRLAERLTSLREGAAAIAAAAAKKRADAGRTVRIVPVAIKYRFLDEADPRPELLELMDRLERRFTWSPRTHRPLVDRIYEYAEAVLGLKEFEYLGRVEQGPLKARAEALIGTILGAMEDRRLGKRGGGPAPVRVKELRRACLDALADPATTPEQAIALRRDLDDLFVTMQLFSYPGDYVRECPSLERVAETLMKFEEDLLGVREAVPRAPRRAVIRFGEPIDVGARLAAAGRPRLAVQALSAELEERLQALLDTIPPGRPFAPMPAGAPAAETPAVA